MSPGRAVQVQAGWIYPAARRADILGVRHAVSSPTGIAFLALLFSCGCGRGRVLTLRPRVSV